MLAVSQCRLNETCFNSSLEDDLGVCVLETHKRKNLKGKPLDGSAKGTAVGTTHSLPTKKPKESDL